MHCFDLFQLKYHLILLNSSAHLTSKQGNKLNQFWTDTFSVKWAVWQTKSIINRFCGYLQSDVLENSYASQLNYITWVVGLYPCFSWPKKCSSVLYLTYLYACLISETLSLGSGTASEEDLRNLYFISVCAYCHLFFFKCGFIPPCLKWFYCWGFFVCLVAFFFLLLVLFSIKKKKKDIRKLFIKRLWYKWSVLCVLFSVWNSAVK